MKWLTLQIWLIFTLSVCGQSTSSKIKNDSTTQKMKIEIWSDIACPFCYIGKHKLDKALAIFSHKDSVEIIWKSFQLNPELATDTSKNIYQSLAESKGITIAYAQQMTMGVAQMGTANNIAFNFDKTIPANTFNAHVLMHFAAKYNKQSEAKEKLFKAYFLDGKNIDDVGTLSAIASELSLDIAAWHEAFKNKTFTQAVLADMQEANKMQISGVPYFVFDRKYAISGAQDDTVFTNTLAKAFQEFSANQKNNQTIETTSGQVCTPKECK